eukprot:477852-Pyramimonas_sp.AAC.1
MIAHSLASAVRRAQALIKLRLLPLPPASACFRLPPRFAWLPLSFLFLSANFRLLPPPQAEAGGSERVP